MLSPPFCAIPWYLSVLMLSKISWRSAPNHPKHVRKQPKIVPIPSKIVPGNLPEPSEDSKAATCWALFDLRALLWPPKGPKSVPKCPRSAPRRSKRPAKLEKHRLQKHIFQWRCSWYDVVNEFQWFQCIPNKKNLDFCWQEQCFEHFSKKNKFPVKVWIWTYFGRLKCFQNRSWETLKSKKSNLDVQKSNLKVQKPHLEVQSWKSGKSIQPLPCKSSLWKWRGFTPQVRGRPRMETPPKVQCTENKTGFKIMSESVQGIPWTTPNSIKR